MARSFPRSRAMGETVREVVARILVEDIQDPRLELVTITSVHVSQDRHHARVYVTTHGDAEHYKEMLTGLESAKRRLRAGIARRVSMKFIPDLSFHLDSSVDEGMRITEAIRDERASGRVRDDVDEVEGDGTDGQDGGTES